VRCWNPTAAGHGVQGAARAGQGERDVDHGEAGADEQHVAVGRGQLVEPIESARRPGVGDEPVRGSQRVGRPGRAGREDARREHHRVRRQDAAVGEGEVHAAGHRAGVSDPLTSVLEGDGAGPAQRLGQGVLQVAAVVGARDEVGGSGIGVAVRVQPLDEVTGVVRQRAHAAGRDVEEVPEVAGRVRDAATRLGPRVDQHEVQRAVGLRGAVDQVDRGQRAGRAGADDGDRGDCRASGAAVPGPGGALTGVPLQSAPHEHLL
jgi:hypothetical protein